MYADVQSQRHGASGISPKIGFLRSFYGNQKVLDKLMLKNREERFGSPIRMVWNVIIKEVLILTQSSVGFVVVVFQMMLCTRKWLRTAN